MNYKCNYCGFTFLMMEGYDAEKDMIICPNCGTSHIREIIKEFE